MARYIGCVDGFVDGELRGWIIDRDQPDVLQPIVCRNREGRELTFRPFTYREDVAAVMGVPGVFGFAVPEDLLLPLGAVFSVADKRGALLENGTEVTLPAIPPAAKAKKPLHIFLHISKTAGTSLRNTLLRSVPPGEQLLIYPGLIPGLSLPKSLSIPLAQRDRLAWVFGHCHFGFDRIVTQPSRYVTFIREPLERLRSNFAHHAAAGSEFEIDGIPLRPASVINDGLSEEFDNVMTRVLAGFGRDLVPLGRVGENEVEIALSNVRRHFALVGRHSQADADTALLQDYLGLPRDKLTVDNVTPATFQYDAAELAAVDWDRVAERNQADFSLYSRLEQEGLVSRILD